MRIEKLRARVESSELAAMLGVASGAKTFEKLLLSSSIFGELIEALEESRDNIDAALNLVKALSEHQIDHRFENPNDTALAAYVRALSFVAPGTGEVAAAFVLRAPNIWWSRNIAIDVLEKTTLVSSVSAVARSQWEFLALPNVLRPSVTAVSVAYQSSFVCNFIPLIDELRVWDDFHAFTTATLESFTIDLQAHASLAWTSIAETRPVNWEQAAA